MTIRPPMRWAMRTKPVRVQFALAPRTTTASPGTSTAAAIANAAERRVAGHRQLVAERELVRAGDRHLPPVAPDVDAGRGEHPLGVVAARLGLDDRRRPVGGERGEQHARLDLGAGDRQRVRGSPRSGAAGAP